MTSKKLKPGTYKATVETLEILENGNVEGQKLVFNIYKEEQNGNT